VPGVSKAAEAGRTILEAARRSRAWDRLADLCDRVGPRLAGSRGYAAAVEWAIAEMTADGLSNVRREPVRVVPWERGAESLIVVEPNGPRPIPVTALGRSVATPAEGITARMVVVPDFAALEKLGEGARGKIVVFNFTMRLAADGGGGYGEAVRYRAGGAIAAAKHGAVAALVRSVTTQRGRSVHTGSMSYEDGVPKIPAAAITIEDSEMLARLQEKSVPVTLFLRLGGRMLPEVLEANVIGELRGRESPDEIVVVGGHLDSWDLACGAHDDGAGVVLSLEAVRLIKQIGLVPRRTIRVVLYANEECGLDGGTAYAESQRATIERHVAALESDSGGFRPTGFGFQGAPAAADRLEALLAAFDGLGPLTLRRGWSGPDIGPLAKLGVPGVGLRNDGTRYFDFHHSPMDTPDKVDRRELDDAVAAYAWMAWLLAEMPEPLARAVPAP
jgi:carboxypeptidase Q